MQNDHRPPGRENRLQIVGGGLAGLVTAIAAIESGFEHVTLHEAHDQLGGRARTLRQSGFVANQGPHVIYDDGPLWQWLAARQLAEPARRARLTAPVTFRLNGRRRRTLPPGLVRALVAVRRATAPVEASFMEWASEAIDPEHARRLANFAGVVTFDHDPGRLSASFVVERIRRATTFPPRARYVPGGWSTLIDRLAHHAQAIGVDVRTSSHVSKLPDPPVVLAVPNRSARGLLDDTGLADSGTVTACLDVGLRDVRRPTFVVSDLDAPGWAETYSLPDPTLAPDGHHLVQAQTGLRPGEDLHTAIGRIELLLDVGMPGWRPHEAWRREAVYRNQTGALDLPNTTWRDRPSISRGDGVMVVNDQMAAPGLLAEVSFNAAMAAVGELVNADVRGRQGDRR